MPKLNDLPMVKNTLVECLTEQAVQLYREQVEIGRRIGGTQRLAPTNVRHLTTHYDNAGIEIDA